MEQSNYTGNGVHEKDGAAEKKRPLNHDRHNRVKDAFKATNDRASTPRLPGEENRTETAPGPDLEANPNKVNDLETVAE